jgi:hypothetical protein
MRERKLTLAEAEAVAELGHAIEKLRERVGAGVLLVGAVMLLGDLGGRLDEPDENGNGWRLTSVGSAAVMAVGVNEGSEERMRLALAELATGSAAELLGAKILPEVAETLASIERQMGEI